MDSLIHFVLLPDYCNNELFKTGSAGSGTLGFGLLNI